MYKMDSLDELTKTLNGRVSDYDNWNVIIHILRERHPNLTDIKIVSLNDMHTILVDSRSNISQRDILETLSAMVDTYNGTRNMTWLIHYVINKKTSFSLKNVLGIFNTFCPNHMRNEFLTKLLNGLASNTVIYNSYIADLCNSCGFRIMDICDVVIDQLAKRDSIELITFVGNQLGNFYENLNDDQCKKLLEILYNKDRHIYEIVLINLYNRFVNNNNYYNFWNSMQIYILPTSNNININMLNANCPDIETIYGWLGL